MPFFSVVIPTYNRADRLRNTLRSVLDQTFPDFEVLVMDDGSTDGTREVVESFADARIRYSWAENSGGPATPRNRGIEAAAAEWVCFLDSDDRWYPNKLDETRRAIAADPSAHVVSHDESLVLTNGGKAKRLAYGPYVADFYRVLLIEGNRCSPSAVSVRKSFLDAHGLRFNTSRDYAIVEDYDFWLRLAKAGANFKFFDAILGDCQVQADSISGNMDRYLHNLEVLLYDHVYSCQSFESDRDALWRHVSVRLRVGRGKQLASDGQYGAALILALRILFNSPRGTIVYLLSKLKLHARKMIQ